MQKWDTETVLAELRRRYRRGDDLSQTGIRGDPIFSAAFRHFGSYRKAVAKAGIEYGRVWRRRFTKWDRLKIVRELRQRHRRGEDLWSRGLRFTDGPLHSAAIHWFGSYRAAVEAAGIEYYEEVCHNLPQRWTPKNIVTEIQRLHRRKRALNHARLEREEPQLVIAMYRYYGTFRNAIEAAGIDYSSVCVRPARTWDPRRVLDEIKKLHRNGGGLWNRAVRREKPYLLRAGKQLFGSFPKAVRAAGVPRSALIPPRRVRRPPLPNAEIIQRLRSLDAKGADLRAVQLARVDRHLVISARYRFGGYRQALLAADITYLPKRPLRHWTWPLVLENLRELHREKADLRYATMKRSRRPLYEAAKYYFGSYVQAVTEAGIDYEAVVQRELREDRRLSKPNPGRKMIGANGARLKRAAG